MKKILFLLSSLILSVIFYSCKDEPLTIGASVQPNKDKVSARIDTLHISYQTVKMPEIYSRSTNALLGDLRDSLFGDLKADYIAQLRAPHGFKFQADPIDGKIDSVILVVRYDHSVGDTTAYLKTKVYQISKPLNKSYYSVEDIHPYINDRSELGSGLLRVKQGHNLIKIKLPNNDLGNKIYHMSKDHPDYFDSQEKFYKNVVGGLYVTTTTGIGTVVNVYSTEMWIFYRAQKTLKDGHGQDSIATVSYAETFRNTPELSMVRHFNQKENMADLISLGEKDSLSFIQTPTGVMTQATISKEELTQKFFKGTKTEGKVVRPLINEAYYGLFVSDFDRASIFDPPTYLAIMPQDSVKNYIESFRTDITNPRTIILSSEFSIRNMLYFFDNIATLITNHISDTSNLEKDPQTGEYIVKKDLVLSFVPVFRTTVDGKPNSNTLEIQSLMLPTAVGLKINHRARLLPVVSTRIPVK